MRWKPGLVITKDPNSLLDYELDFTDWLEGGSLSGGSIVVPAGLTLVQTSVVSPSIIGWFSGGTVGESYTVIFRPVKSGSPAVTDDFSLTFFIADK